MKFLLDDVVFSTISLFDYLGNAIGFVLLGKKRQNIKWKGVLERSASKNLPTYQTVSRARELNDEWVGGLTKYRHSLIHVASDKSGGKLRHHLTRDQALLHIRITASTALVEEIGYLRETVPREGLPVTAAALWLIGQTFDAIIELCDCLMRDLVLNDGATGKNHEGDGQFGCRILLKGACRRSSAQHSVTGPAGYKRTERIANVVRVSRPPFSQNCARLSECYEPELSTTKLRQVLFKFTCACSMSSKPIFPSLIHQRHTRFWNCADSLGTLSLPRRRSLRAVPHLTRRLTIICE
jgi:hypothetical protein